MSRSRDFHVTGPASQRHVLTWLGGLDLARFPEGLDIRVRVHEEPMTDGQRKRLFALCGELADQVDFPGGGRASAKSWKSFLVALHRGETKMEREGLVVVVLNGSVADATKQEASDLIAFVEAWGVDKGVRFRERRAAA